MADKGAAKSVEDALKQRLDSPVVGTFLLSFIVTNWQIFIFLTAGNNCASCRIKEVAAYWTETPLITSLGIPIGVSIFYLGLLPVLQEWYENFPRLLRLKKDIKDLLAQTDALEVHKYKKSMSELLLLMRTRNYALLEKIRDLNNVINAPNQREAVKKSLEIKQEFESYCNELKILDFSSIVQASPKTAVTNVEKSLEKIKIALGVSSKKTQKDQKEN